MGYKSASKLADVGSSGRIAVGTRSSGFPMCRDAYDETVVHLNAGIQSAHKKR